MTMQTRRLIPPWAYHIFPYNNAMVDRSLMHSSTSSSASSLCSSSCFSFPFSFTLPFSFLLSYMSVLLIDPFSFPSLRSSFPFLLLFFFCVCSRMHNLCWISCLVFFTLHCSIGVPNNNNNNFFSFLRSLFSSSLLARDSLLTSRRHGFKEIEPFV